MTTNPYLSPPNMENTMSFDPTRLDSYNLTPAQATKAEAIVVYHEYDSTQPQKTYFRVNIWIGSDHEVEVRNIHLVDLVEGLHRVFPQARIVFEGLDHHAHVIESFDPNDLIEMLRQQYLSPSRSLGHFTRIVVYWNQDRIEYYHEESQERPERVLPLDLGVHAPRFHAYIDTIKQAHPQAVIEDNFE